jgi:hypothetical protein
MSREAGLDGIQRSAIVLGQYSPAIKGMVVMSKDLEGLYNSIFNNQVPEMWAEKAYTSIKPLASWVTESSDEVDSPPSNDRVFP